ncbi:unnamed protein product [Cuscuta epithymum]|uniref:Uncharacterized protein n=1 Tax=Cuscuta epithymum TaxID=186058 RepID=A0AAV0GFQ0_9ASTE|nr:unnamed protein product [Cuscuta epithymum]
MEEVVEGGLGGCDGRIVVRLRAAAAGKGAVVVWGRFTVVVSELGKVVERVGRLPAGHLTGGGGEVTECDQRREGDGCRGLWLVVAAREVQGRDIGDGALGHY